MTAGISLMLLGALWVALVTTQLPGWPRTPLYGWGGWLLVLIGLVILVVTS